VLSIDLLHDKSEVAKIVTVSIGVATARADSPGVTLESFLAATDQALYRAKEQGRNRVVPWQGG
jgi:diguanylate cyclase (GGDEF)-like protein